MDRATCAGNAWVVVDRNSKSKEGYMATTFLKRQKEMKRLEKQREKAERRAQKKLAESKGTDALDALISTDSDPWSDNPVGPEPESKN
jgi:hypothetical protein